MSASAEIVPPSGAPVVVEQGADGQPHPAAFNRKLDPKEQQRMNAMFANMSKQSSQFITNESNVTATIDQQGSLTNGDLKSIPTLYFKGCRGCDYTISHRTTKVLIEDCHDTSFTFTHTILTSTLEAWKCKQIRIRSDDSIKTLQLDLSSNVELQLGDLSKLGTIVWNSVENLSLVFEDSPQHNMVTGFRQMLAEHSDSNMIIDQFIIRNLSDSVKQERCIRLKNGFLSTEREAVEWERKNELFKERYVHQFLKDSGITINKKQEKAIPPNDPCPCKSGKKYKRCCFNKAVLSGVEGVVKTDLYRKQ